MRARYASLALILAAAGCTDDLLGDDPGESIDPPKVVISSPERGLLLPDKQIEDFVDAAAGAQWASRYTGQMRYEGFRQAILATARGFIQSDPGRDFEKIGAGDRPTLLIWGDADRTFPIEQAGRVREALGANLRFERVAGAGHALHYENANKINALLSDFLPAVAKKVTPRPARQPATEPL